MANAILTAPLRGITSLGIVLTETIAPDLVAWCCFDEYWFASEQEKLSQLFVLPELVHVAFGDDLPAVRLPHRVVESTNRQRSGIVSILDHNLKSLGQGLVCFG